MGELVLTTYDWVPEWPRGHVRDIRARWALEEAGLPYRVESTQFKDRGAEHFAHQPFGQVPWLTDGDLSIFESGAILMHLGGLSDKLMPTDPRGRSAATEWVFAALNSIEMVSVSWIIMKFKNVANDDPIWKFHDDWLDKRLTQLDTIFANREWLAGSFSIADILMSEVLRVLDRFERLSEHPACRAYIAHATARPAFKKAYADQMAHFAKADKSQSPH